MKKWQYLIAIGAGGLALYMFMVSFGSIDAVPIKLVKINRGNIINDIRALGRVEAVRETNIRAYDSVYIKHVLVNNGDIVKPGELLMEVDTTVKKEALEKAKLKVEKADIKIEEAKRKLSVSDRTWYEPSEMLKYLKDKEDLHKQAVIEKEAAQREVFIARELYNVGAESALNLKKKEDSLKDAEIKLSQTLRELNDAIKAYKKKEKTGLNLFSRKIEYQMAIKEKDIAEAELKIALSEYERLRVVSPIAGSVTKIDAKDNMHVERGGDLISIADLAELQVKAEVDEIDATKIKPGQKVLITFQGNVGRKVVGQVKEVSPVAQIVTDRTIVYVIIAFNNDSCLLRIANQVDVNIIIDRRNNVLRLPLGSLCEATPPYTFRNNDGIAQKISIQTGLSDSDYIEVKSGLNEGDLVIAQQNPKIKNGVRIIPLSD